MILKIKKLDPDVVLPSYSTHGSACFDIRSNIDIDIEYRQTKVVKTGLIFDLDDGFEIEIRQRSGLSINYPNYINNAPGTIDSDYRGELCIIINNTNFDGHPFIIKKGDRIAQGKINYSPQVSFEEVNNVKETLRGSGGFGHTGKN